MHKINMHHCHITIINDYSIMVQFIFSRQICIVNSCILFKDIILHHIMKYDMNLLKNKLLLEYSHLNPKECFIRETHRDIYYVFITQNVFIVIIGDNGEYEFIEIHKNTQNNITTLDEFAKFAKNHNSSNDGGENLLYELNALDATGGCIEEYADINHVMSLLRPHINNAIL